ncbi:MAG: septum site-determining protein MinC [Paenibacillaceae bacterium]|nr:septum site-determining protein MinC [Paenibacillaceae bacterium]
MTSKHLVSIKGVKDGLVFKLDDQCNYDDLLQEMRDKLEKTHQRFLAGPQIHVHLKFGKRPVTEEQKDQIKEIIGRHGNLEIRSIDCVMPNSPGIVQEAAGITVKRGIVRSGQTLHCEGNVLFLGDVNPGGSLTSSGDIYILGSLRGMAHAGASGNEEAIISASHMKPTQLRIGSVISRPPDEWGVEETYMEFAYVQDGKMEIDKIHHLHRVRPDLPPQP